MLSEDGEEVLGPPLQVRGAHPGGPHLPQLPPAEVARQDGRGLL